MKKQFIVAIFLNLLSCPMLAQVGENPWASQKSEISPWGEEYTIKVEEVVITDSVVADPMQEANLVATTNYDLGISMKELGRRDAKKHYKSSGVAPLAFTATLGTLLFPPIAFVPVAFMVTQPKNVESEENKNNHLLANTDYREGYRKGARQVRAKYAIGGVVVAVGLIGIVAATFAR